MKIFMAFELDDAKTFEEFKTFTLRLAENKKLFWIDDEETLTKLKSEEKNEEFD